MTTIAIIGLGTIGTPIARNAAKVAQRLSVWNRTADKVWRICEAEDHKLTPDSLLQAAEFARSLDNAQAAATVEAAVQSADIVMTILGRRAFAVRLSSEVHRTRLTSCACKFHLWRDRPFTSGQ